jgi:hypothetical protein
MKRTAAITALIAALSASFGARGECPADVVAAQIRLQGHRCDKPVRAARDVGHSQPGVAAWLLECRNAAYRVRLVPHRAARVELIVRRTGEPRASRPFSGGARGCNSK